MRPQVLITITVIYWMFIVYMARNVMILMGANPFPEPLERVGYENQDFWALKWQHPPPLPHPY